MGFWEGLLEHWVAELLIVVGGVILALLRKYKDTWAPIVGYGVGGATCVAVIIFTFTGHALFSPPPTDQSNVEANLKKWIEYFGYGSQNVNPPSPEADFAVLVTPTTGVPVVIFREKKSRPGYLQLLANLQIASPHSAILQKITPEQAASVMAATEAEVLRHRMAFTLPGGDVNHVQSITIIKTLVIDGLTQVTFGDGLDDLESTVALTRNDFNVAIQPYASVSSPLVKSQ
jgi:hypothetical protein